MKNIVKHQSKTSPHTLSGNSVDLRHYALSLKHVSRTSSEYKSGNERHSLKVQFMSHNRSPNMEAIDSQNMASQDIAQETPAQDIFVAPSIHQHVILAGASYTYHSMIPAVVTQNLSTECVLGVDEAGRGPVLGEGPDSLLGVIILTAIKRSYGLWSIIPSSSTTPVTSRPDTSL